MPASIFSGQFVKFLKSKLNINDAAYVLADGTDPRTTATTAPIGSLHLNTTSGVVTKKLDAGSSTNWQEVGAGLGVNNYISANDGSSIGSWVTYADAAATTPVDGAGGSPSSTFAVSTSSAMRGLSNFLFTHSAANRQGEGFSYTMAIDPADRGKVLRLSFDYLVASGTYADDDLVIYFYDVTNSALIQPAPYKIKNSSLIERFSSEVQVPSSCASLRVIFHVATSTATAYTMRFDDFVFGQQAKLYGSPITDAIALTTTTTPATTLSNFGNGTAALTMSRRGNLLKIKGALVVGSTLPTGTIKFSLPAGLSADYSTLPKGVFNSNAYQKVGTATTFSSPSSKWYIAHVLADNTSLTTFYFQGQTSTYGTPNDWAAAVPYTFAAGDTIQVDIEVPILGWSSSVVMSSDADTRVLDASYGGTASDSLSSTPIVAKFTTQVADTHGIYNTSTGAITIPTSGWYSISTKVYVGTNATANNQFIQLDLRSGSTANAGTLYERSTKNLASGVTGAHHETTFKDRYFSAGDIVSIQVSSDLGASRTLDNQTYNCGFSVKRASGPSQIAANETIAASYSGNAGDSLSGTAILFKNTTKNYDTHGIYNSSTGVITIPTSGKYVISGNFLIGNQATANNQSIRTDIRSSSTADSGGTLLFRNLSYFMSGQNPTAVNFKSPIINALAGEVYSVQIASDLAASRTLDSNTFTSNISIVRVGN